MSWRRPGLLAGVIAVIALVPLVIYLWVALHRIGYPYELDWMEGGAVEQVRQLLGGHSLYAPPSLKFTGWTYPPLYWLVCAGVAKLVGIGYLPLRLVSLVSSIVAMGAIARIVLDQTGDRIAAIVAAGLFAAAYRISGDWFDIGRLDSLFLALTLLTLVAAGRAQGVRGGILVGLLALLALLTKQIALVALAPALLWLLVCRWRAGLPATLVLLAGAIGSTLVLDGLTHGWYRYYVSSELAGQPWVGSVWVGFWTHDLLAHLWPLAVLVAAAVVAGLLVLRRADQRPRPAELLRTPLAYLAACVIGLTVAAWFSRLHTGGYANVLMPAYAACAIVGGVACARLRRLGAAASVAVAGLLVVQLIVLAYSISGQVPSQAQHRAGEQLLSRLSGLPGPVLVLRHPWYATQVGKGSFAHSDGIAEILRSEAGRGRRVLRRSLRGALDRDHIQAVVLDSGFSVPSWLAPQLSAGFRLQTDHLTKIPLRPATDERSSPSVLYLRRTYPA